MIKPPGRSEALLLVAGQRSYSNSAVISLIGAGAPCDLSSSEKTLLPSLTGVAETVSCNGLVLRPGPVGGWWQTLHRLAPAIRAQRMTKVDHDGDATGVGACLGDRLRAEILHVDNQRN